MMKRAFTSASALALVLSVVGYGSASAQQSTQPSGPDRIAQADDCDLDVAGVQTNCDRERDRVVVTGSNIAGASESAALPVEVYSQEDAVKSGNASVQDFIKNLSVVGSTEGETNQFIEGQGNIGASSLNLRGLGGGRTLTIFNGRRFSENTNMIPQIALSRTEILKDGGAVIYGADATGGVVNFITRDSFDGLLLQGDYRAIDGTDGDWSAAALWGKDFDQANLMFAAEYSHQSKLPVTGRDWAVREYAENDTPWAPYGNYSTFILRPGDPDFPFATDYPVVGPLLGLVQDYSDEECINGTGPVAGIPQSDYANTGLPACLWNYAIHTFNLIEEIDQVRLYGQFTADLDDSTRFTAQLSYGKSNANEIGAVAGYYATSGTSPQSGPAFQYRTPSTNPYFADFFTQNAASIEDQTGFPVGLVQAFTGHVDQFLTAPFGVSGNPAYGPGNGSSPSTQLENWNAVAALEGAWGDWSGGILDTWKLSLAYNLATSDNTLPDTVAYKVQEALNGFGGPNCNAQDLVVDDWAAVAQPTDSNNNGTIEPIEVERWKRDFYATIGTQNPGAAGQNGCLWLNPFASSFAANGTFGTPNPRYIQGNENTAELGAWLNDERQEESTRNDLVIDALTSGSTPFVLPGGAVMWAAGAQWRQNENRDNVTSEFMDPGSMPCQWPGQQPGIGGCPPTGESPYFFYGQNAPNKSDQQQYSYFAEAQVPVLDNLGFQLAVRREEFPRSGLGATVYKVAGKWDPFSWLAIRGSFGTNYATPPNVTPGDVSVGLSLITNAGNQYLNVSTEVLPGFKPETAEVANFGAIFNFDQGLPLDGSFRLSLDYFNFQIKDEIKTVSHNDVLNSVFLNDADSSALINCSAALIDRITFIGGKGAAGCVQGATIGDNVTSVASVRGNGPGANTAGIDIDATYTFDALGGEISAGFQGTNILEYEIEAFVLNGAELSKGYDGVGFINYGRGGDFVSEWRSSTSINYENGNHNLRYIYRFIQGVKDPGQLGTRFENIDDFVTHNLYYQYTMPWDEDFVLNLSVENVLDEDPPFSLQQYSYDPAIGNPRGRIFKIGVRKQF
ncbi:MAG: TonB-dependent receptor [Hyphomonadaceae bacterium]|nr:TonB-dependent receptor [Hyphomonadaceae bacterium]